MRSGARVAAGLALVSGLAAVVGTPGGAAQAPAAVERAAHVPMLDAGEIADPAVVRFGDRYVVVSTGPWAPRAVAPSPRGPWQRIEPALATLPSWAISPSIWAVDLVPLRGRWVLYYSVLVRGLGAGGRCIGVATSTSPLGTFTPSATGPLVCPASADTPPAGDRLSTVQPALRRGVIDPSYFRDRDGRGYLLYKTQRRSTIRAVRVRPDGLAVARRRGSFELLRSRGVMENPVLLRRGDRLVLLTSEGYFGDCGYRTVAYRSGSLTDWSRARRRVVLRRAGTGLCGPGGADVVPGPRGAAEIFFHAWTCHDRPVSCPGSTDLELRDDLAAQRSLFGARLAWSDALPVVVSR